MKCPYCSKDVSDAAKVCPQCGQPLDKALADASPKSRMAAALLCFFFGWLGVHRFYVGKAGTGVLMLLTLGGLGLWALIDFIIICCGGFRDREQRLLLDWGR